MGCDDNQLFYVSVLLNLSVHLPSGNYIDVVFCYVNLTQSFMSFVCDFSVLINLYVHYFSLTI